MAEIEEVASGAKKIFKGKNGMVFAAVGAGVAVLALVLRPKSETSDTVTAAAGPNVEQAVNSAMGQLAQGVTETINQQNQSLAQALQNVSGELTDQQREFEASVRDQINSVVSNVQEVSHQVSSSSYSGYSPTPPISEKSSKPSIVVKAGSVEEKYLKDQYGDKVNIVVSTSNEFVGKDREETNAMYAKELAKQGVTADRPISSEGLWNY